ncbi:glycosyltransferase family A protein [Pseudonocardia xishanensis]|uniref:4,4'-diaponeurosporenoate glycosyltransferase n=1 Tax=Pseudonocardia xishanensis TaxID=630995 RepID=A0ABP8S3N7_9PSEU
MIEAVGVLVPARDEAAGIARCLRAVRVALAEAGLPSRVCVVADRCRDETAEIAAGYADVVVNETPLAMGELRNLGVARLPARGWVLSTDADTVVPPNWVVDHLRHARAGADAVAGMADLDDPTALGAETLGRYSRLLAVGTHAYAANLGVRADMLHRVGGFPAVASAEEHALLARLRAAGGRVVHATDVRVRTSARTRGRAQGGLADLLRGLGA